MSTKNFLCFKIAFCVYPCVKMVKTLGVGSPHARERSMQDTGSSCYNELIFSKTLFAKRTKFYNLSFLEVVNQFCSNAFLDPDLLMLNHDLYINKGGT